MKDKKKKDSVTVDDETVETNDVTEPEAPAEEATAPIVDEWHDRYIRLAADFDNFKKRSKTEKDAVYANATADTVAELLPIIDNLERALTAAEDSPMKEGVEMVLSQALKAFEKLGVTPAGTPGEPFDPKIHNAVMHVDDDSLGENTVAQVLQKGYLLGDKVIRYAMVAVAN